MTDNTDGTAGADKPAPVTSTEQQATTPPSDTGGRTAEDRIAGAVAERERHKQRAEKAEADLAALVEKHKTEDEKLRDQWANERAEPLIQRVKELEDGLVHERDELLETMPEDSRDCYDEAAPIDVQLRQIKVVAKHLSTPKQVSNVDSGGNPIPPRLADKTTYTRQEYLAVQKLAVSDPDKFDEIWPEYRKALVENRIEGMSGGSIGRR